MSATIHDVCDYVILRCASGGTPLNFLKLQKLLYYCQAWSLAFGRGPLFKGAFQAWVHGPVSREIYDRFSETKSLYSEVGADDVQCASPDAVLSFDDQQLIDSVLEAYNGHSGVDLEAMTHQEAPWIEARGGLPPLKRCENEISEDTMRSYYAARLQ